MASNVVVKCRIKWLGGGDSFPASGEDDGEVRGSSLIFRAASKVADMVEWRAADRAVL